MTFRTRAVILGHWAGNIGHEIMAVGVEEMVQQAFPGCEIRRIEQHRPMDIYPEGSLLRAPLLRHARGGAIGALLKAALNTDTACRLLWPRADVGPNDVGIACGGPLMTSRISESDLGLMYHHLHGAFTSRGRPLLNLSVGSCFPFETKSPPSLNPADQAFMRRAFLLATATTVRDRLALELCGQIGETPDLIPDTGFLAGRYFARVSPDASAADVIAINYQERGANEDWGQNVSVDTWASTVKDLVASLGRRHRLVFVCHGDAESALAQRLAPDVPRFVPKTGQEYARFVPTVKAAVCNRLHAAIGMAGYGIPVIAVGTDSRLKTLEEVGLPTFYVKNVTAAEIESRLEDLVARRGAERERLMARHAGTMNRYVELLRGAAEGKL